MILLLPDYWLWLETSTASQGIACIQAAISGKISGTRQLRSGHFDMRAVCIDKS